jgi:ribosomal protein S30
MKLWDREVIPDICTVIALYKRSFTSAHKLQLVSFRSETSDTSLVKFHVLRSPSNANRIRFRLKQETPRRRNKLFIQEEILKKKKQTVCSAKVTKIEKFKYIIQVFNEMLRCDVQS